MMESSTPDGERHPHGDVHTEVVDDHILVLTVDRVEKKNAFTPKITAELEDALTRLDEDPDLFVGVLTFAGDHTTAGLEMPLFFTDEAKQAAAERRAAQTSAPVDPFSLGRRLTKPRITALQGITFTIGIEIALGGDIVVAASDLRMCQLEPKRGLAPLGGATVRYVQRAGWGNAMYHLLLADEFGADEAYRIGLVQEVVEPGQQREPGDRARSPDAAVLADRACATRSPTPASPSTRTSRRRSPRSRRWTRSSRRPTTSRRASPRSSNGDPPCSPAAEWTSTTPTSTRPWRRPAPSGDASTSNARSTTSCSSTASTSPSKLRPAATSAAGDGSSCATRR